jgi:hypothetical protein
MALEGCRCSEEETMLMLLLLVYDDWEAKSDGDLLLWCFLFWLLLC